MNLWSKCRKTCINGGLCERGTYLFSRQLTGLTLCTRYLCGPGDLNPWTPGVNVARLMVNLGLPFRDLHSPQNEVIQQD